MLSKVMIVNIVLASVAFLAPTFTTAFCPDTCPQCQDHTGCWGVDQCERDKGCKRLSLRAEQATFNVTVSAVSTPSPTPVTAVSTLQFSVPDPTTTTAIALSIATVTTTSNAPALTVMLPTTVTQADFVTLPATSVTQVITSVSTLNPPRMLVLTPKITATPVNNFSFVGCKDNSDKCFCRSARAHMDHLMGTHPRPSALISAQSVIVEQECVRNITMTSASTSSTIVWNESVYTSSSAFQSLSFTTATATVTKRIDVLKGEVISGAARQAPLVVLTLVPTLLALGALLF